MRGARPAALQVDLEVAGQVALGAQQLVVAGRRLQHSLQLHVHGTLRLGQLVGRRADVDGEEARRHALDVDRAHGVGETLAVAKLEEEPAALARQQLRDHLEREAVVVGHRETAESDHQVRLLPRLARLDARGLAARRIEGWRRRHEGAARQLGEQAGEPLGQGVGIDVAGDADHQVLGLHQPPVVRPQHVRVEALHGGSQTAQGVAVGMLGEERAEEEVEDLLPQAILAAGQRGQRLAPLALDLLLVEGGTQHHLCEEVERGRQLLAGAVHGEAEAAAAGEAVDIGGEAFDAARQIEGGAQLRAAQPGGGQEARDARRALVLGQQSAEAGGAERHHRHVAPRRHVELDAAGEAVAHDVRRQRRPQQRGSEAPRGGVEAPRHGGLDAAAVEASRRGLGQDGADREVLLREMAAGHAEEVLGCRLADGLQVARLGGELAGQQLEASELAGDARDALVLEVLAGQEVDARALQLLARHGAAPDALDLAHHGLERILHLGRIGLEARGEEPGVEGRVGRGVDAVDQARVLLHVLHETAALAAAEDVAEQVEDRRVGVGEGRDGPYQLHARALERATQDGVAKAAAHRLHGPRAARAGGLGAGEGLAHAGQGVGGDEVAHQHHRQVVRAVPAAEEVEHASALERRDALRRAEDRPAVGVRVVRRCEDGVAQHGGGRVVAAADLLQHHLDLAGDLLGVEARKAHHVAQHIDARGQLPRRKGGVVDRDVVGGVGVDAPAHALDLARHLADAAALGALEEHVLVEMGEPQLAGLLVGGADAGPDLHRRHRRHVQLLEQHGDAALEALSLDGKLGQDGRTVTSGGERAQPGRLPARPVLSPHLPLLRLRRGARATALGRAGAALRGGAPARAGAARGRLLRAPARERLLRRRNPVAALPRVAGLPHLRGGGQSRWPRGRPR